MILTLSAEICVRMRFERILQGDSLKIVEL